MAEFRTWKSIYASDVVRETNLTYINRKSLSLIEYPGDNLCIRCGERFVLHICKFLNLVDIDVAENMDFSGFAHEFFELASDRRYVVSIYGGTSTDLEIFTKKLLEDYNLTFNNLIHGYLESKDYVTLLQEDTADLKLLGLGNPKQNEVIKTAAEKGITGMYTCGAFISQHASTDSSQYYKGYWPRWIQRSLKERNHLRRTVVTSIQTIYYLLGMKWTRKEY